MVLTAVNAVLSRFAAVDLESTHIQQKLKVLTKLVGRTGVSDLLRFGEAFGAPVRSEQKVL